MMLNYDESDTGVLIQTYLQAPGAPTKDVPIFWDAAVVPAPLPSKFIVIEPLFPTEWRSGACITDVTHTVQIRAAATSIGGATSLRASIRNLLPRTVFGQVQFGPRFKTDSHYDAILTVQTITAPRKD